ncbi:hypothetical protein GOODEAATRI_002847 [Goodea atripinnis]|uniref:Uncharacterized protein n=1 Tax=Goodea atripinnis TaxID=208336 RepID=A0ABV0N9T7_9TELE
MLKNSGFVLSEAGWSHDLYSNVMSSFRLLFSSPHGVSPPVSAEAGQERSDESKPLFPPQIPASSSVSAAPRSEAEPERAACSNETK